jgi:glycosyltransferase involved in cell wall biosynthesis
MVNNRFSDNQLIVNLSILLSQPTGISNYAKNIFPYLKPLNPTLLTTQEYPNFNCYPVPNNLTPAHGTKGHFDRLAWTQFQLPQIYKKLQSQLLFSPLPEAPLSTNCRFVVMVHDLIPLRFPKRFSGLTPYFRYYIPQVLAQAEHIICNSQATAKDITDFYQIPTNKITSIPLAHDRIHFRPLLGKKEDNRPYFLYLGRQDPYKNLHRLIAAFAALPNHLDCELWLAGPSDKRYTPLLKAQVAELGITQQVKFLDYVSYSELPTIITKALALVFPSLWEGFGFPVLEAMACGTPVITSNISSLPEVAGDAGILINPYNTEEITEAMQKIATNERLRSHLSTQATIRANQFSWEKTGQATIEVLSRFL